MAADTRAFLTAGEAAVLLRIRPAKVLSWIRSGELPAADLSERPGTGNARWKISRADLDEFLRGRRPAPPAPKVARRRTAKRPSDWVEFIR